MNTEALDVYRNDHKVGSVGAIAAPRHRLLEKTAREHHDQVEQLRMAAGRAAFSSSP